MRLISQDRNIYSQYYNGEILVDIEDYIEFRPFYICNSVLNLDEDQTMDILYTENLQTIG